MADVLLRPQDLTADGTWALVEWCLESGADEFSCACLHGATSEAAFCVATEQALQSFALRRAPRAGLTRRVAEPLNRETRLCRLNDRSLVILRRLLPDGIFTDRQGNRDGWIEDLTVYRNSDLLLGVITHEHEATLRASDAEVRHLRERSLLPSKNSVI